MIKKKGCGKQKEELGLKGKEKRKIERDGVDECENILGRFNGGNEKKVRLCNVD